MRSDEIQVRVRYEETDQMGVVYHANFLRYFEIGRTEALRARGMSYRELEAQGFFLAVVDLGARYHGAARYDDLLTVRTRLSALRHVRLRFEYEVLLDPAAAPLVTGYTVLACLNARRRPCKLPEHVLSTILG